MRRMFRQGAYASLAAVAMAACGSKEATQSTWDPKGKYAASIDKLQRPIFYVAGIVGVIVTVACVMAIARFRERPDKVFVPHQSHGNNKVEIGLTALSAAILLACAVPTINVLFDINENPKDALQVNVIGQQWWWEFQYPESGIVTASELVIPAGRKVRLNITSRDVIHSFWIPALNGKRDAVPNRYHPLNLLADEPGTYQGQCTEFCGLSHANMRQRVVALSPEDFEKWEANQKKLAVKPAADTAEARGEELFAQQCARCHQINGLVDEKGMQIDNQADEQLVSGAAPNLTHLMSRSRFAGATFALAKEGCETKNAVSVTGTAGECLDRAALEAWLRNAPEMKPMYSVLNEDKKYRGMPNLGLSEAAIDDLVAYLKTLS